MMKICTPIVVVVDTSASMAGEPIQKINEFISLLRENFNSENCDLCIITFGQDVRIYEPFSLVEDAHDNDSIVLDIQSSDSSTALNNAIMTCMNEITLRKRYYDEANIEYRKPRLFLATRQTDSNNRNWDAAFELMRAAVEDELINFYLFDFDSTNEENDNQFAQLHPILIHANEISSFFSWVSASVTEITDDRVGFDHCLSLPSIPIPSDWDGKFIDSSPVQNEQWYKTAASSGDPDTIAKMAEIYFNRACTYAPTDSYENTTGNSIKKVKPQQINKVDFSVVSPEIVKPGNSSVVDIYMYTKKQRRIVDEAIKKAKEKLTEATRTTQGFSVKQGSKVTIVLSSDDAIISDKNETLVWSGDALNFKFRFSLPDEYKKRQVDFSCNILFDGIHISRLYFSVKVNTSKSVPVRFVRKDSKEAFVSYSHKDKQRVVDQIISIQKVVPRMRFWMDNQSMSAGDQWRPAIASAIKSSDVFLLFWSINAKSSSEVRKEWEYALRLEKTSKRRRSGSRFISPVPLDNPSICPPPEELSDLHFGDPSFDSDIEHIDEINFVTNTRKFRNIRKVK